MPKTPYPRPTLRRLIKAHTNLPQTKNTDILVYLDYVLFLQELVKDAGVRARERGASAVGEQDVRRVVEGTLRKFEV
ncbi:hypothetical protein EX30DRAFT_343795 [Ascodesmis nigricans]|uniref:Transcription factor CBF/NF-Y/archaeal histone domain-containing protein n=1 Tax=Ascodesmis nigricans TaxID=341454 RepID=A0A4S2ML52_9PEZI|nr:hypothetical protein EX30DRAFT_343795 [Ascodesmis nigricans]